MGDLVIRISLMVQRGFICSACGVEIDGQYSETVRQCSGCKCEDANAEQSDAKDLITA